MAGTPELVSYAVRSYRYLRLAIVVVVAALIVAVVIERVDTGCWQPSISAYYFTPVHAVFVGALVAIGVCLIAVKGSTDVEDVLLNVAGVLAPIVAFVPTSPPGPADSCPAVVLTEGDVEALINNNVLAFLIGGVLALGIAGLVAVLTHKATVGQPDRASLLGWVVALALPVVGVIWYVGFRDSFLAHAHGWSAAAMFGLIGVVIVINAVHARPGYRQTYVVLVVVMVLAGIGAFLADLLIDDWRHRVLWLEVLELVPFAVFWAVQTFEHWDGGVPTGSERELHPTSTTTGAAAPRP